jgi:hypothetical protein
MRLPFLITAWKRPSLAVQMVKALYECGATTIYISLDGPRSGTLDIHNVDAVYQVFSQKITWTTEVYILKNAVNLGLFNAVTTALDWFYSREQFGIILEDDVIPTKQFVLFCKHYFESGYDPAYPTITGDSRFHPQFLIPKHNRSYMTASRLFSCWGWGTWDVFWHEFSQSTFRTEESIQPSPISLGLQSQYVSSIFLHDIRHILQTRSKSWAYRVFIFTLVNRRSQVVPAFNLIQNLGGDDVASNTRSFTSKEVLKLETINYTVTQSIAFEPPHDRDSLSADLNLLIYHCSKKHFMWVFMLLMYILRILICYSGSPGSSSNYFAKLPLIRY